jgi:hypothetical protein
MANMNIRTPRFYCDRISYLMSRGLAQDGNFDVMGVSNTIAIQTGSEAELFDMRPLNKVDFNTSAATGDHVLINIDTQNANRPVSFVAILNHNCNSASARIKIRGSDTESHVAVVDMASAQYPTIKEIVNGDDVSTSVVTPATDGSTIISWTNTGGEQTYRYWGIQFEGDSSFDGSTDLFVGCIMIGEYFEMPTAPDMNITRMISYNRMNDLQESYGGQRFSNLKSFGRTASSTSKSPFTTGSNGYDSYGGRIIYDMNFSFMSAANMMPDEYDIIPNDEDNFVSDVWNMTSGNHLPFIMSIDKDSEGDNAESEHIFGRFANNSLDMKQVAPDMYNISLTVEEEF